jgi:hypothetical protein
MPTEKASAFIVESRSAGYQSTKAVSEDMRATETPTPINARAAIAAAAVSAWANHAPPAAATRSSVALTLRGPKRSIAKPTGSWQSAKEKKYMLDSRPRPPADSPNSAASVGASTALTMRYTYEMKYPARKGPATRRKSLFSSSASRARRDRSDSRSG